MSVITAANATQLTAALKAAKGGETILLTGDDYGSMTFSRIAPATQVTIKSDDVGGKATFRSINLSESKNLTLDDLVVRFTDNGSTNNLDPLVRVYKGSGIAVTNSLLEGFDATTGVAFDATVLDSSRNVIGLPVGRGFWVDQSTNVRIASNELTNLSRGIALTNSSHLTVANNHIHDLRTTGIQAGNISETLIARNHIHSSKPWNFGGAGDHGDYIHIWTVAGSTREQNSNVKIIGNLLEEGAGVSMLGIYLDDNLRGIGFGGYEIRDNVLLLGEHQAIRLENVQGVVANNTMLQTSGTVKEQPLIVATDNSNVKLADNILSGVEVKNGAVAQQSGNMLVQKWNLDETHYSSIFDFDGTDGVSVQDILPLLGGAAAGADVGADLALFQQWLNPVDPAEAASPVGSALADALTGHVGTTPKISSALFAVRAVDDTSGPASIALDPAATLASLTIDAFSYA